MNRTFVRGSFFACAALAAACGQSVGTPDGAVMDGAVADGAVADGALPADSGVGPLPPTSKLDLLVVVDNSGSMAENQATFMAQLGPLLDQLTNPPCVSRAAPGTPRVCDPMNPDLVPMYRAVRDLHVGVISTDLGTPGFMVPGCDDSDRGDDGLLNPIRNGFAMQRHLPWAPRRPNAVTAPPGFRPSFCSNDVNQFPSFITFCSNAADPTCDVPGMNASTRDSSAFSDWFKCNAGIFINGCGLESQLESVWRSLVEHDARGAAGNTSPNAGFVRDDAALAIVMLTDEDDGSVRDCAHDNGFSTQGDGACSDAKDVYNTASGAWAHPTNPDLRFYLYTPGDRLDPNWNLNRYVNTAPAGISNRWTHDLLSLKPGHPERIVFAAITGVPVAVPMRGETTDWDALLGSRSPSGPDDFYGRDSSRAVSGTQEAAGPFSMRQANMDPMCSHVVPACRRQGGTYDMTRPCSNAQYMAFPSRRIVEVARRFDEAPLCSGQPCRNGMVASICSANYAVSMIGIVRRVAASLSR